MSSAHPTQSTIRTYWATVVTQHGVTTGTPPRGDPTAIKYTVKADDPQTVLVLPQWTPERRISEGAQVLVAKAGDPCIIRVTPSGNVLWMLTEGIPFIEACAAQQVLQ